MKSKLDTFIPITSGVIRGRSERKVDEPTKVFLGQAQQQPELIVAKEGAVEDSKKWVSNKLDVKLRDWEISVESWPDQFTLVSGTAVDEYWVSHPFLVYISPNGQIDVTASFVN